MMLLQDETMYGKLRTQWRSLYKNPFVKQIKPAGFEWIMPQNAGDSLLVVNEIISRLQSANNFADRAGQAAALSSVKQLRNDIMNTADFKMVNPYYTPRTPAQKQNYAASRGVLKQFQKVIPTENHTSSDSVSSILVVGIALLLLTKGR